MASPGLLFLLLVSSSLLPSTSPSAQDRMKEAKGKIVKGISFLKDTSLPFLGLIKTDGALISALVNLALGLLITGLQDSQTSDVIQSEFKSLNSKVDKFHAETIRNIWSAGAFSPIEMDINIDWDKFIKILDAQQEEKKQRTDTFINDYKKDSIKKLSKYLTAKESLFTKSLSEMINETLNCHENDLKIYTFMINALIAKSTVMSLFYSKQKKLDFIAVDAIDEAFNSSSMMFKIDKNCLFNSMKYAEIDVKKVIDVTKNTKKRQKLAHEVRLVLAESYGSYDWMVVAFKTRNSKHKKWKSWDKHVLLGFTEVSDGDVTVAVARQAKGKHTMADKVRRAIERCVTKSVECHQVRKVLEACKELVGKFPVTQTYSAVHAFIDRPHDSYDAKEAPEEIFADTVDPSVPYFYKGACTKYKVSTKVNDGGKFIVLIKSDEEIENRDPCSNMDCGGDQRGTCVAVKGAFIAVCECNHNYYGLKCENSFDDDKTVINRTLQAQRV